MKIKDTAIKLYSSQSQAETAYSDYSIQFGSGNNPKNTENQIADRFSLSTNAADLMENSKYYKNAAQTKTDKASTRIFIKDKVSVSTIYQLGILV